MLEILPSNVVRTWSRDIGAGLEHFLHLQHDIPPSSKSIQFDAKTTRTEPDDKIKLREVLRPLCLSPSQYFGSRKILKVFMVHDNINRIG